MTIPYEIIPYDTIQWHVPHHTMSYHGCCYRRRYHTVPCHGRATVTQPHVVTVGSSFILASVDLVGWSGFHAIPYYTVPYHTIPYHTIPYYKIIHVKRFAMLNTNGVGWLNACRRFCNPSAFVIWVTGGSAWAGRVCTMLMVWTGRKGEHVRSARHR